MVELDRISVRLKLCTILQRDYVALLGQRGNGIDGIIRAFVNKTPLLAGMKFIAVSLPRLPRNALKGSEFEEMFLDRLQDAASRIPPEKSVSEKIARAVQERSTYSANYRIRKALDILGRETSAKYLVIILHALATIEDEPLKNLLLMLREYHDQRDNQGEAGERLRFLVTGEARLWSLCYHKTSDLSPFNIAERVFLDGLSYKEIQMIDTYNSLDASVMLRDLTDGVPSLIEEALKGEESSDDLSPYFSHLQDCWTALPPVSQELLKNLAEGSESFPECQIDYRCPQIPVVKSPWLEAFWEGFLRLRYRQLAWRSQIHQGFIMKYVEVQDSPSKSIIVRADLRERAERLSKAVKYKRFTRSKEEPLQEAVSLACQTYSPELATVLQMVYQGEKNETIVKKVEQLASLSERDWIKELGKEAVLHKETIREFLIEAILARANHFLTGQFDVFLCHNGRDKDEVKEIARQLKNKGVLPWLDEWELPPGQPWQRLLEQQITQVKSAAVFIGRHGIGSWQREELDSLLSEFNKRGNPVIPVLLMSASQEMETPTFLSNRTWVDFRKQDPDPLERLIWGITGKRTEEQFEQA